MSSWTACLGHGSLRWPRPLAQASEFARWPQEMSGCFGFEEVELVMESLESMAGAQPHAGWPAARRAT